MIQDLHELKAKVQKLVINIHTVQNAQVQELAIKTHTEPLNVILHI